MQKNRKKTCSFFLVVPAIPIFIIAGMFIFKNPPRQGGNVDISHIVMPAFIDQQIIDVNGSARRGEYLEAVRNIAVHYIGNPGTTAQQNRNYFANPDTNVSAHFLVGLDGEIIQCVPLDEKSSATNHRNLDTISIEVCHPDKTGKFSDATYQSLVKLSAWLCQQFDLTSEELIRHFDVTGKNCPLYFVEHEDAWIQFKADVKAYLQENPDIS